MTYNKVITNQYHVDVLLGVFDSRLKKTSFLLVTVANKHCYFPHATLLLEEAHTPDSHECIHADGVDQR